MDNKKQFIKIQLSLFFGTVLTKRPDEISVELNKIFGENLNSQILGIPDNAPDEIPRLVVSSSGLSINLAKNRLDIFSEDESFIDEKIEKIIEVTEFMNVGVKRIGYVLTFFKENAFEDLLAIFNKSKLGLNYNPKEIGLRLSEEKNFSIGNINNAQTYELGSITRNNETKEGVIIVRDINTSVSNNEPYSPSMIKDFISEAKEILPEAII